MVRTIVAMLALVSAMATTGGSAWAQETIRIGILGQFSGPFAQIGVHFRQAIETFQSIYGTKAGGREVELVYRDIGGSNPAVAKRLAEELIVKDRVSMIGGFYLSSEATAAAPVLTETKTPGVLFMAASLPVVSQSPFFVRVSNTIWHDATAAAEYALKQGKKRAYIAVSDYAPGHDVQQYFKERFTSRGGEVVGEVRMALNTVDYAPFAERITGAKPDVVMVFVPTGAPQHNFLKSLSAQGVLGNKNTMVMGFLADTDLHLFDDSVIGLHVVSFYSPTVRNEENRKFLEAYAKKFGGGATADTVRVNQFMVGAYNGMYAMYRMIEAQKGPAFDSTAAVNAMRGHAWTGPNGPLKVEPDTRDITMTEFVRRIDKVSGKLDYVTVDTFPAMKAPAFKSP